ncbi:MAG: prevent-host-death protein [Prevotellaceae bacterium]|jgi:antitoxin (DNA-binding transcriptional repressor) of toxin-antitoxin stability system|nr:prevent-host-death protein [Prevotellaceae bacterium]
MLVISGREFGNNQAQYLRRIDEGERVVVQWEKGKAYSLVPVTESDLYFTPEMLAKIDRAMTQYEEGRYTVLRDKEELHQYFESL